MMRGKFLVLLISLVFGLAERRRFDIPNPLMTGETLAIPADYWHEPFQLF